MSLPLISVITPSYNQGVYIKDAIESVLSQKYPAIEHIVVDGVSTDETVSILTSYSHLRWVSEPDRGQSHALNKAIAMARGEIIAWLNADDWYAPAVFHDVASALQISPLVMGNCELTDSVGRPTTRITNKPRNWFHLLKYWVPYTIPTQPAIFFRRSFLDAVRLGPHTWFDESLHFCMDFDLWMRMAALNPFNHRMERVVAYYRMSDSNKTGDRHGGLDAAAPEMSLIFRRYSEFPPGGSQLWGNEWIRLGSHSHHAPITIPPEILEDDRIGLVVFGDQYAIRPVIAAELEFLGRLAGSLAEMESFCRGRGWHVQHLPQQRLRCAVSGAASQFGSLEKS